MGLRAAGECNRQAAGNLLVGAGLGPKPLFFVDGQDVSRRVCGDTHLSDHALEPDTPAGTLKGLFAHSSQCKNLLIIGGFNDAAETAS